MHRATGKDAPGQAAVKFQHGNVDRLETLDLTAFFHHQPPAADFAHAFIGAAQALEIPARYVTGYVAEHGEDAFWHAWVEAWDDGLGWIGFDPMLGYCPTDKHVRVAVGLDAGSVPPVRSVPVIAAPVVDVSVAGQ